MRRSPMTTRDENTPPGQPEPRKKGGGDGNAKSATATPKARPDKTRDEASPSKPAAGRDAKSRKITNRG
jgi:hypothetical protein